MIIYINIADLNFYNKKNKYYSFKSEKIYIIV